MFTLSMFALLGMFIMISGNNFLVIYLGLELLTLSSYALVALRRDNATATEAAMKYFVLGALASGLLLYGMSMVYGATGSLEFVLYRIVGGLAVGAASVMSPAYIAEVSKMSDIVSSSVKDAVKPLNERVTAAVERLQAAR